MNTIKDMPEHSRPREKLREKGASALTDEELVAAILGRGMMHIDRSRKNPRPCIGLGIKCMTPFEMLRRERARFILGPQG